MVSFRALSKQFGWDERLPQCLELVDCHCGKWLTVMNLLHVGKKIESIPQSCHTGRHMSAFAPEFVHITNETSSHSVHCQDGCTDTARDVAIG